MIVSADMEHTFAIYGLHPEYHKGIKTKRTVSRHTKVYGEGAYADVMHINKERFLVLVTDPLSMTLQCKIENKRRTSVG